MTCRAIMIAACAFALASPGHAEERNASSFRIRASVPEICAVDTNISPLGEEAPATVGIVSEYCNTGDGYRLTASHRTLAESEQATLLFENREIILGRTGESLLAVRSGPVRRSTILRLAESALDQPVVLNISIASI